MAQSTKAAASMARVDVAAPRGRWTARIETALILLGLAALLLLLPHHVYSDGEIRYREMYILLQLHRMPTEKFSLIGPLFSTPVYLLGLWLGLPHAGVAVYNWVVFVVGLGAAYLILRRHLSGGLIRKFFLVLIAASMFPNHLTNYYGEPFTAMCVGVGILAALYGPRLAGWIAIVLGAANTPATLIGLGLVTVQRVLAMRRVRYLLVPLAAAALVLGENWLRRGSPFDSGYEHGFTFPILIGVLSILFSFGKGLLFFTPGLLLPIRQRLLRLRDEAHTRLSTAYMLWMVLVVGMVLVYAQWDFWYGGWWWGPRYFLIASLPASLALAVRLHQRDQSLVANAITLLILAFSVWVGINGAVFDQTQIASICMPGRPGTQEFLCYYMPQDSVLWRPFLVGARLSWQNVLFIVYAVAVFCYLAAPLLRDLVRQLRALGASAYATYVKPRGWSL